MVKDRVRDNGSMGQFDELNRIPDWAWETIIGGMKKVVHRGNSDLERMEQRGLISVEIFRIRWLESRVLRKW